MDRREPLPVLRFQSRVALVDLFWFVFLNGQVPVRGGALAQIPHGNTLLFLRDPLSFALAQRILKQMEVIDGR